MQQLGPVLSPGMHDTSSAGIALVSCGMGEDASSKTSELAVFSNRSSRLAGPGIGKPAFDSECGKKGSASRQRVRFKVLLKKLQIYVWYVFNAVCFFPSFNNTHLLISFSVRSLAVH